ncbi:MAG: glycosyltransferase family 4 protein [Lentisphaerae bacterium]|jgi:glycosyltransferase involved in cell wall biosynthesis|nr:glycosyltransferase family 4 protein [Lentisphaerota bacterium]
MPNAGICNRGNAGKVKLVAEEFFLNNEKHKKTRKIVIDASVCREPASGVHLAARHSVQAEIPFLKNSFEPMLIANFSVPGIECVPPPSWAKNAPGRIAWQQFALPRLLRRHGAEILHAQAYTMPLKCTIPVLLNVHDIIALEYPEWCSRRNAWHMRTLLPASIRKAEKCLVPTRHVAERIYSVLGIPFRKIEVVSWGVDFRRFSTRVPLEELQIPKEYFLFVGNIEPKKNLELLLKAYASCAERTRLALVIVGRAGWKCRDTLKALRHWKGPGKIYWMGRLPDQSLTAVYQQATALIMPSLEEGFGLPVLEGMAAGIPVLHSKHPALIEVAGGAGLAFSQYDSDELAKLMIKISENPDLRKELIRAGRERAHFLSWERCGRLTADILMNMG